MVIGENPTEVLWCITKKWHQTSLCAQCKHILREREDSTGLAMFSVTKTAQLRTLRLFKTASWTTRKKKLLQPFTMSFLVLVCAYPTFQLIPTKVGRSRGWCTKTNRTHLNKLQNLEKNSACLPGRYRRDTTAALPSRLGGGWQAFLLPSPRDWLSAATLQLYCSHGLFLKCITYSILVWRQGLPK